MLPSLQTYGKPSTTTQKSAQSTTALDGRFVKAGSLDEESEDKDILNWLYKDEEASTSTSNIIETNQYGKGKTILEKMGYSGQGPLGLRKQGITEPI